MAEQSSERGKWLLATLVALVILMMAAIILAVAVMTLPQIVSDRGQHQQQTVVIEGCCGCSGAEDVRVIGAPVKEAPHAVPQTYVLPAPVSPDLHAYQAPPQLEDTAQVPPVVDMVPVPEMLWAGTMPVPVVVWVPGEGKVDTPEPSAVGLFTAGVALVGLLTWRVRR